MCLKEKAFYGIFFCFCFKVSKDTKTLFILLKLTCPVNVSVDPNVCYFRSEYYTIPPLAELNQKIDGNGDVFVDDFVVGRQGYGQVKFYGRTNVAGLNLDEIGEYACDIIS